MPSRRIHHDLPPHTQTRGVVAAQRMPCAREAGLTDERQDRSMAKSGGLACTTERDKSSALPLGRMPCSATSPQHAFAEQRASTFDARQAHGPNATTVAQGGHHDAASTQARDHVSLPQGRTGMPIQCALTHRRPSCMRGRECAHDSAHIRRKREKTGPATATTRAPVTESCVGARQTRSRSDERAATLAVGITSVAVGVTIAAERRED
jgi:hypothetical protein